MNLQPPDGTARRSPAGWWSLTPPSHPYRPHEDGTAVIFFCLHLLSPTASIFGSGAPCAARTFLPHPSVPKGFRVPATSRNTAISGAKVRISEDNAKRKLAFLFCIVERKYLRRKPKVANKRGQCKKKTAFLFCIVERKYLLKTRHAHISDAGQNEFNPSLTSMSNLG